MDEYDDTQSEWQHEWIDLPLREYLDTEMAAHVAGARLNFFAADVASKEPEVRAAYAAAFESLSD